MKNGQPPLIFGYGRVNPVAGEKIHLEDITWTPLGVQHASNFEDLSPALQDDNREVVMIHSVALPRTARSMACTLFRNQPTTKSNDRWASSLAVLAGMLNLKPEADEAVVTAALKARLESNANIATLFPRLIKDGKMIIVDDRLAAMDGRLKKVEDAGTKQIAIALRHDRRQGSYLQRGGCWSAVRSAKRR